jgi:hypothetical protein
MTDLTLPDFLDRKTNGVAANHVGCMTSSGKCHISPPVARTQCQREIDSDSEQRNEAVVNKEGMISISWTKVKGVRLAGGMQNVEVIRLGYKWVYFKPAGRNNSIKVSRDKWDEIVEGAI